MTLAAFPPYTYYTGDGTTRAFAYPFEVERPEDFVAFQQDTLVSNYSLTGLGEETGGLCTFSAPPAPGVSILLLRRVPLDQETIYPAYSPFPAAAHEKTLDRLCMQVWQLQEQMERTTRFKQTIRPPWRNLEYPAPVANTLLGWDAAGAQWTLHPSGVQQIAIDPVSGLGWGKITLALRPVAGTAQCTGLLFPPGVLGMAVSAWISADLGTSQGLQQVGIGTPEQPDSWGLLSTLTAETESSAGLFQGYSGQPQRGGGLVALTAYGGTFDGTGEVYVTGHFVTFKASRSEGVSFHPGSPEESVPFGHATETQAGILELATTAETTTGTNDTDAVTPLKLAQRLTTLPAATTTQAGVVELATTTETTTGTDATRAVTPAGLAAKVPTGTALSVVRYAAGGTAVEAGSATVVVDASGRLGVGTAAPNMLADVVGGDLRVFNGILRQVREAASANQIQETFSSNAGHANALTVNRYSGTFLSPAAAPNVASIYLFTFRAHDGTAVQTGATLAVTATGQYSGTDRGTTVSFSTCASGSTTLAQRLSIDAQGDLTLHGRSSTQDRPQAVLAHAFVNATDTSRTSRLTLAVHDATTTREGLRIETSGTAPMLSFYGANAVVRPTVTGAKGGNAALTSLLSALSTLGLVTDSST